MHFSLEISERRSETKMDQSTAMWRVDHKIIYDSLLVFLIEPLIHRLNSTIYSRENLKTLKTIMIISKEDPRKNYGECHFILARPRTKRERSLKF